MLKSLMTLSSAAVLASAMHYGEININNKDVEAQLNFDMGQYNHALTPDTIFVGLRYMNVHEEHGDYNEAEEMMELSYLMRRPMAQNSDFSVGFGIKANYIAEEGYKFVSLPLGLEGAYRLPIRDFVPISVGAKLYYAPEVLALQDAKNYLEFRVHVDAEVIEGGKVTAGYRKIDTDYEAGDATFNRALYIGFQFAF